MRDSLVIVASGSVMAANVSGLVAELRQAMALPVVVVLTAGARRFVTPDTVRFLGGAGAVYTDDTPNDAETPNHLLLAHAARLLIVYPASAGFLGRIANGLASDLAATVAIATPPDRILLFPSMHADMWSNPSVQRNISSLESWGCSVNHSGQGFPLSPGEASAIVQRFSIP